jgi:FkbM family methyltransferase
MVHFATALFQELMTNLYNDWDDNHDHYRFGPQLEHSPKGIKGAIVKFVNSNNYYNVKEYTDKVLQKINSYNEYLSGFENLYNLLADEASKQLLIKVLAYRILGKRKVKLPLNKPDFWNTVEKIRKNYTSEDDFITVEQMNLKLQKIQLRELGYQLELYYVPEGIFYDYVFQCYSYLPANVKIQPGDIVIDAGGCYGDTALQFAHDTGTSGHVFSFEFIPSNKTIWQKNVDLNPNVKPQITLVDRPLWDASNLDVFYKDAGPGSKVSFTKDFEPDGIVKTITIDELVASGQAKKVDFIKMDIEGAELKALHGAVETIKFFKPKLAISLYHSPEDFGTIPAFIHNLNLGYKFYFNHYTIHQEESVLFAIAE